MSILPILNPGASEIRLNKPDDEVLPFDKSSFKPVIGIADIIANYSLELSKQIEIMAKTTLGEGRSGSKKWSYWNANPNIHWRMSKNQSLNQYFLRSINNDTGEYERLSVELNPNGEGKTEWLIHGHMPGVLVTNFNFSTAESFYTNDPLTSTNDPLTSTNDLTRFIHGQGTCKVNPQLVHHILIQEAKWLAKLASKEITRVGSFNIKDKESRHGHIYTLTDSSEGNLTNEPRKGLEVETDSSGNINRIFRFNYTGTSRFIFELSPKTANAVIDADAELRVVDRKAQAAHVDQISALRDLAQAVVAAKGAAAVSAQTLAAARLTEDDIRNDARCMETFHVGYNKSTPSRIELHRNHLFSFKNLQKLLPGTGLIYRHPETKYEKVATDSKNHKDIEDFFKYTKMLPGTLSLAFLQFTRFCKVHNYPKGEIANVSIYGNSDLRSPITQRANDPQLNNKDEFKRYLTSIGCQLVEDDVEKAICRWGIRASKDALAKKGIVYEEATQEGAKDKIYLVDIGGKADWQNIQIKRVIGNEVDAVNLRSYPGASFFSQISSDPPVETADSEEDLRKIFEHIGFDVVNTVDTENFIQSKIQTAKADDPVIEHLKQRWALFGNDHRKKYEASIRLKTAMRRLAELGYKDVERSSFTACGSDRSCLKYKDGDQLYLGYVSPDDPKLYMRKALTESAQTLGAKAQILKVRDFRPVLRTIDMEIRSLAL